ncbi:MAG: 2Fe-2S iron-sulfur cluster-binding protein [Bacteroidota bacterium]
MAKITFITSDQETITIEASGGSIMELAVNNNIKGINGDCGGVCSCATCHVHLQPDQYKKLDPASELEQDMLEFEEATTPYSRLGCQIPISDQLDGFVFQIPQT